jgi:outer membrane receptor protein involved in Fe transport
VGDNDTLGSEVAQSGVWGRASYSIGGFRYKTDGFRENNDHEQDLYNVFAQVSLTHKTSAQGEFRYKNTENGDLPLRFDPNDFTPTLRQETEIRSTRFGFHHAFSPNSDLIGSFSYQDADAVTKFKSRFAFGPIGIETDGELAVDEDGYMAELQHLFRSERFSITSGIGHFNADGESISILTFQPQLPPVFVNSDAVTTTRSKHSNVYAYGLIHYPKNVTWTIGSSVDLFERGELDRDQINPKFGLTWYPFPNTTLRAAVFRVLKRSLISEQTVEPTQVAGFNQFFDDANGADVWRYGVAIDQKFSPAVYGGVEYSRRDLEVPFTSVATPVAPPEVREADWEERLLRAYLYWTPHEWLAVSGEYLYERFERDSQLVGPEQFREVKTHRFSPAIRFFHPSGISAGMRATYVDQEGIFGNPMVASVPGEDNFWVVDASVGYRFPKRYGIFTFGVRNLLDEEFKFQGTNPINPTIAPERTLFTRFTLAF